MAFFETLAISKYHVIPNPHIKHNRKYVWDKILNKVDGNGASWVWKMVDADVGCSDFETIGHGLTCFDTADSVGLFSRNGMKVRVTFGIKKLNKFNDGVKFIGYDGIDGVGYV